MSKSYSFSEERAHAIYNLNPIVCRHCKRSEIEMKVAYTLGAPRYCPCGKIYHRCNVHPFMQIEGPSNNYPQCSCKS